MAEYIPITDQEIEPEAPLTSILHHKLRDNLIAIAEGSPGAPIFQVFADGLSIATWQRSFSAEFADNIIQGGGIYGKTFEYYGNYGSAIVNSRFGDCFLGKAPVSYDRNLNVFLTVNFSGQALAATFFVNYNAPKQVESYSWIFVLLDINTNKVESVTFQDHHISLGMSSFINHPFVNEDLTGKQVFLVNLTKLQNDDLKTKTIPKTDGLYFENLSSFDPQQVDYFRPKKSMIEVFNENYSFDFNPLPWLNSVKFSILSPYRNGIFPRVEIPEPEDVTRIGVIPL